MTPDRHAPGRSSVRGRTDALCWLAALGACAFAAPAAHAQAFGEILDSEIPLSTRTGRNLGVLDRYFEKLSAQGLPAGGFRIFPSIDLGIGRTSNVIGSENDPKSDFYAALGAQVQARSQWSRHEVIATASYDGKRFFETPQKNENGYLAQVSGRFDIQGASAITASASHRRIYEEQFVGSFPVNGGGSIGLNQSTAMLRGTYVFNRLRATASTDINRLVYSDTVNLAGDRLSQAFRDRTVWRMSGRLEYLIDADNAIFGQVTYRNTTYDDKSALRDRSSKEWRILGGAIADVTSLVRVAIGVGYNWRSYGNPTFRPMGGVAVDARADYFATTLTTFSLVASRKIEEAIILNSSGYIATRVGGRVDHELLRNLRLNLNGQYQKDNYGFIDRRDSLLIVGGGASYTISRNFVLQPRVEYISRKSDGVFRGPDINEFRTVLSLTARI